MATIEERAKAYSKTQAIECYAYCGYKRGAVEQREIDIERACDLFADCMNDAVKNGVLSSDFARNNIETFRKYLTEQ